MIKNILRCKALHLVVLSGLIILLSHSGLLLATELPVLTPTRLELSPDLYILESALEEGRYIDSNIAEAGFRLYDYRQLPREKELKNRMYTFIGEFLVDEQLRNTPLSLYIGPTKYPYIVYLNGIALHRRGTHTSTYDTAIMSPSDVYLSRHILHFGSSANRIAVEVFTGYEIFPFQQVYVSTYRLNSVRAFWKEMFYTQFIKGSSFVSLFLFIFFLFYFLTREDRDIRLLYFAMVCLFFSLSRINFLFSHNSTDELLIEKISKAAFPLVIMFLTQLTIRFTGILSSNLAVRLITVLPAPVMALVTLFPDTKTGVEKVFSLTMILIIAPLIIFSIVVLSISYARKNKDALFLLAGHLMVFAASIHDLVYLRYQLMPYAWLSSYGYLFLVISIFFILAWEQARMYLALQNTTADLQQLNRDLDKKIEDRTSELNQKKKLLEARSEIIENELMMAKRIQKQFIPSHSPSPDISFYYRPMDQVGGDFYDFISFSDSRYIGIFISDVSGHGVPAAFITSMIKSALLQTGSQSLDPSVLMEYLNRILFNQTAGNFVTAFYGIMDLETRCFTYCNCGHNPPFIIRQGGVESVLSTRHMLPLAIFNKEKLAAKNRYFSNDTIVLSPGDKMLLYTDGLTEAVSIADQQTRSGALVDFESARLYQLLKLNSSLPSNRFVKTLVEDLIVYRGSEDFDDDVCIICMDVV